MADDECHHRDLYDTSLPQHAQIQGGYCQSSAGSTGTCQCRACRGGGECRNALQLSPGKGEGLRLILSTSREDEAAIAAAEQTRWAAAIPVHLHTALDSGKLDAALSVPAGKVVDVEVGKQAHYSSPYPFSNCSKSFNVDSSLCRRSCLRRHQATACCGLDASQVPRIVKGKFVEPPLQGAEFAYDDPIDGGDWLKLDNPLLACPVLADGLAACMRAVESLYQSGEICVDGARGLGHPALNYGMLFFRAAKENSYEDEQGLGDQEHAFGGTSDMEDTSLAVQRHCVAGDVWLCYEHNLANGGLSTRDHVVTSCQKQGGGDSGSPSARGAAGLLRHTVGVPCEKSSECRMGSGEDLQRANCVNASRAFCPQPCSYASFVALSLAVSPISRSTIRLLADREVALAAKMQAATKRDPRASIWRPRCRTNLLRDPAVPYAPSDPSTWPHLPVPYALTEPFDAEAQAAAVARGSCLVDPSGTLVDSQGNPFCLSEACMTREAAEARVADSFVILNLDFTSFSAETFTQDEAMPLFEVLGIFGGSLGLFVGFSVMTLVEWFEILILMLLGAGWLFARNSSIPIVRGTQAPTAKALVQDEDVQHVLCNVKKIARHYKHSAGQAAADSSTHPHEDANGDGTHEPASLPSAQELSESENFSRMATGSKANTDETRGNLVLLFDEILGFPRAPKAGRAASHESAVVTADLGFFGNGHASETQRASTGQHLDKFEV